VHDLAPIVSGVDDLVSELNSSNDFAGFVKKMRTNFKRYVLQTSSFLSTPFTSSSSSSISINSTQEQKR
jgi:hypothetical protein